MTYFIVENSLLDSLKVLDWCLLFYFCVHSVERLRKRRRKHLRQHEFDIFMCVEASCGESRRRRNLKNGTDAVSEFFQKFILNGFAKAQSWEGCCSHGMGSITSDVTKLNRLLQRKITSGTLTYLLNYPLTRNMTAIWGILPL